MTSQADQQSDKQISSFPLQGVIGVVSNADAELDLAVEKGLQCVEIRADLLLENGHSIEQLLTLVSRSASVGLATLLTLRHKAQGGKFDDDEQHRISLCRDAMAAGASIIDVEAGTTAAETLLEDNIPLILSYHNFERMLEIDELHSLSDKMSSAAPAAIKIVPVAKTIRDAISLLHWVRDARNGIRRIGFGMGEAGALSRIFAPAFGSPVTYASFGDPVAPGQIAMDQLLHRYHVGSHNQQTRLLALIDHSDKAQEFVQQTNQQLAAGGKNAFAMLFKAQDLPDLLGAANSLRLAGLRITAGSADKTLRELGYTVDSNNPTLAIASSNSEANTELEFGIDSERAMLKLFD